MLDLQSAGGFSTHFVEALLGLVSALSSSSSGCNALAEAGIVPALLPLIKDQNPDHIGLLGSAVRPHTTLHFSGCLCPQGSTLHARLHCPCTVGLSLNMPALSTPVCCRLCCPHEGLMPSHEPSLIIVQQASSMSTAVSQTRLCLLWAALQRYAFCRCASWRPSWTFLRLRPPCIGRSAGSAA